jgi:ADP-heptose:LPS heptosyltransferase
MARLEDDVTMALRLRRQRFDVAIDLHGGPRGAWLTWASGAPRRIGYTIRGRGWMYTDLVARSPDLTPRHSVLNQFDLLAPLGIAAEDEATDPVEMPLDATAAAAVGQRLCGQGIAPDHALVVMHVSAGNPFRRWPAESFVSAAAALARRDPRRRIILVSGPSDAAAAAAIAAEARTRAGEAAGAIRADDYDLPQLRALIDRAAVYIGGDSGPLHIAATSRTPIVALLGPTLPERSRPWRDPRCFSEIVDAGALPCRPCDQRRCVVGDFRCLTSVDPELVVAAAERAMETKR